MPSRSERQGASAASQTVYADPVAELAVKNAKYIKLCTELYLAHKNIEELRGFERFVNLEALWVNNNELQRLSHLENNFRLKHLYAQNNQIASLKPCARFKFLESLHLFNNKLTNLDRCLATISRLKHLKTLDLFENPIAQEENYRLRVIYAMPPSLEVLDRQKVKAEERAQAALMFGKMRSAEGQLELARLTRQSRQRSPSELVGELSDCTLLLLAEVDAILRKREQGSVLAADAERDESIQLDPVFERIKRIPDPEESTLYAVRETLSEWERRDLAGVLEKEFDAAPRPWTRAFVETVVARCEDSLGRSLRDGVEAFLERTATNFPDAVVLGNGGDAEGGESDGAASADEGYLMQERTAFDAESIKRQLLLASWALWAPERYAQTSNQLFDQAEAARKKMQTMMLASGTASDDEAEARQALQTRILADAARAYRLGHLRHAAQGGSPRSAHGASASETQDAAARAGHKARGDIFRMFSYEPADSESADSSKMGAASASTLARSKFGISESQTASFQRTNAASQRQARPSLRLFFQKL